MHRGNSINADYNLAPRLVERSRKGRRLATILLVDDVYAWIRPEVPVEKVPGAVGRAVIDDDHLEIWIGGVERGLDGFDDHVLFVVRGDQDPHRVRFRQCGAVGAQLFKDRQQTYNQGPPAYQKNP